MNYRIIGSLIGRLGWFGCGLRDGRDELLCLTFPALPRSLYSLTGILFWFFGLVGLAGTGRHWDRQGIAWHGIIYLIGFLGFDLVTFPPVRPRLDRFWF